MIVFQEDVTAVPRCCDGISYQALGFDRVQLTQFSSRGTPYHRWVEVGMPRVDDAWIDCVCYLFRDEDDARNGSGFGGTAFLVQITSEMNPEFGYVYAVTNWHVACRKGFSVLRVNALSGDSDIFPFGPEDWHFLPEYDIAVAPIKVNPEMHRASTIPIEAFLAKEHMAQVNLGLGEDVFMVGRFIDHDGGATNGPAVRFGNLSILPSPIMQPNDRMADSFCIDLRSRTGYSGSPVFVYRTPVYDLSKMGSEFGGPLLFAGTRLQMLLGIHWGQFPEQWEINGTLTAQQDQEASLIVSGNYVVGQSGMTCVLPAWCIKEVLDMPRLVEIRQKGDAKLRAMLGSPSTQPVAE